MPQCAAALALAVQGGGAPPPRCALAVQPSCSAQAPPWCLQAGEDALCLRAAEQGKGSGRASAPEGQEGGPGGASRALAHAPGPQMELRWADVDCDPQACGPRPVLVGGSPVQALNWVEPVNKLEAMCVLSSNATDQPTLAAPPVPLWLGGSRQPGKQDESLPPDDKIKRSTQLVNGRAGGTDTRDGTCLEHSRRTGEMEREKKKPVTNDGANR